MARVIVGYFPCPSAITLYTVKKRCGVVCHFDICSQGHLPRLSAPLDTVCVYVIQDIDSGLYLSHRLLGMLALAKD
jgi:hypothetical protein